MKYNFYRAFEEKYRGSRENIKKRQEIYLPFILPLHKNSPEGMVFDIGCGRGEWLELMREHDIPAKGVDLDEGMLEAGLSLGLDMVKGDGVAFLRNAEDESAIAITSFHVVEHISFDQLQDLVSEAHRVLKPGGVLILETPNPENIRVASETFYLDPTHTKPIPSGLLSFVTQYYGYSRSKVVRLQELEFLKVQKYVNIAHLLENVSPDYAVVAQKGADKKTVSLIDKPFAQEYGISLAEMVEKFERRINVNLDYAPSTLAKHLHGSNFAEVEEFGTTIFRQYILEQPNSKMKDIIAHTLKHWSARSVKVKQQTNGDQ